MRDWRPARSALTGLALALGLAMAGCMGFGDDSPPVTKAEAPAPQSSAPAQQPMGVATRYDSGRGGSAQAVPREPQTQSAGTTPTPPQAPPGVATKDASSPKGAAEARMATAAPQAINSGITQLPPDVPGVAPRAAGRNPVRATISGGGSDAAQIPVAPPPAASAQLAAPAAAPAPAPAAPAPAAATSTSSVAAALAAAPPPLPASAQPASAQPAPQRQQDAYQGVQTRAVTRNSNKMSEGSPIPDREQAAPKPVDKTPVTAFYQPPPTDLPKLPGAGGTQTASAAAKPPEPLPLPAGIDIAAAGVSILDVFRKDNKIAALVTRVDDVYADRSAQVALEYAQDRTPRPWTNPDTGTAGTITPTKTYAKDGTYCREFAQTIELHQKGDVKATAQTPSQVACRQSTGRWKFLP